MHLMLAMSCWLSSPFALQCAKSALPHSKNSGKKVSKNPKAAAEALQKAVAEEAKNRANSLLEGILRYIETPYARNVVEPPAIWRCGNARLLDYGATAGTTLSADMPVALFVPSLINRYYILDLEEERSMLRFIATQGIYPLVLDWGAPGEHEKSFDCSGYITGILEPAIDFISKASGGPITLAGYCMGGVLALAAALRQPKQVSSLALFATPWDFGCKAFAPFVLDNQWLPMAESMIRMQQSLPADIIQSLFYLSDPWVFEQKFRRFYELQPESRAARDFVALEHWVNDGIPMTSGVAQDCLIGWAQQNQLVKNQWKVAGKAVNPAQYSLPCFIAIPRNDHVVPFDCALPLASKMPNAHVIHPGAGHVGMIVGSHAKRELWQPLAEWLHALPQ